MNTLFNIWWMFDKRTHISALIMLKLPRVQDFKVNIVVNESLLERNKFVDCGGKLYGSGLIIGEEQCGFGQGTGCMD